MKTFTHTKIYVLVCVVICTLFLNSCTKDLPFDSSQYEKKLVINSIFQVFKPFKVKLTTSRNILDVNDQIEQVKDATVVIKNDEDEVLEVLTHVGAGNYKSINIVPFIGENYRLEVSHPKLGDYYAESSIPKIKTGTRIDTATVSYSNREALEVSVLIDDNSEKVDENYIFEVELKDKSQLAELGSFEDDVLIYGDQELPRRLFLNDKLFNGSERDFRFLSYEGFQSSAQEKGITEIRMINASKQYHEYYKSLEQYILSTKTLSPTPSSNVKVYSNIVKENGTSDGASGIGIFAGKNVKYLQFEY